ncbi:MAG TPA: hypothetical protein VHG91_06295 [Longimicrobium sp.]|nr:hypothetical protein [Longimicrobium sp.]
MTSLRLARPIALLLAAAILALPAALAAQIPPDEAWRVIDTEHFRVHYHGGLEPLARRAGDRAETAWAELREAFVEPPRGKIEMVVTDNVDYANGFASPIPRNRVVIFAHPPVDDPSLAFYDDWVELVITHELVHVFHLDYARGPYGGLRGVFGRAPFTFPNVAVPDWTVEGLATHLESRLTRAGRVRGTMHEMAIRTAVLEDRFFPVDRATGDPARWPAGNTAYVYGSMFLDWLAERRGPEAAGRFVKTYGNRLVPFFVDDAARRAYGVSFTRAWEEWRTELETRYRAEADALRAAGLTEPEVLTTAGRYTRFPRYSPDGARIAYATATGRERASTRVIEADGSDRGLDDRTTLAPLAWEPGGETLLTAMIDARDPYRYFADLYRVRLSGGDARLTRNARITEADVARDGRIAAIRSAPGTTVPVVLRSGEDREGTPLAEASLDVQWAAPRWSPDGTRIALARWRAGGRFDVVVLDAATGRVVTEVTDDRAVDMGPAWSPDGRYVVFSSDRTGIANLYAHDTLDGRLFQVTNVLTGAFEPDVSPDGRSLVFSYYRADGYHIARLPFDPSAWRPAPPVRPEVARTEAEPDYTRAVTGPSRPYSPLRSLVPTAWSPLFAAEEHLGVGYGAAVGGEDVIERDAYGLSGLVRPESGRWDAAGAWIYRGVGNPVLGASAYQDWDVLAVPDAIGGPGGEPVPSALLERERSASAVATFLRPRFRSYAWLSAGLNLRDRRRAWEDPDTAGVPVPFADPPPDVGAVATLGYSTTQAYDFSIGTQRGFVAAASVEGRRFTRPVEGEQERRGYVRTTGRFQGYQGLRLPGFARHVLAARVVGGADAGTRSPGYRVGGTGGGATASPILTAFALSDELELPLRGYPDGAQVGDRAVAATAEYRFPLALVERGVRVLPLFLDRLWGAAFVDAGTAWCVEFCESGFVRARPDPEPLFSVGAELGTDFTLFYDARFRLRFGGAVPLSEIEEGEGLRERPSPQLYFAFGQSF